MSLNPGPIIRVAKLVALFGFFLPWVLVSCSGQEILSATGLALATGQLDVRDPISGTMQHHSVSPNALILLAALVVCAGAILSFREPFRGVLKRAIGLAVAGLALSFFGVEDALRQLSGAAQNRGASQGLISYQTQGGFKLTIVALIVVVGVGLYALRTDVADARSDASEPHAGD